MITRDMPTDTPSPAAEGRGGRLTPAQRAALKVLAERGKMDTCGVSFAAGHRYGPWAYEKLRALKAAGLARQWLPDRVTLTTWEITPAGREALSREKAS